MDKIDLLLNVAFVVWLVLKVFNSRQQLREWISLARKNPFEAFMQSADLLGHYIYYSVSRAVVLFVILLPVAIITAVILAMFVPKESICKFASTDPFIWGLVSDNCQ